MMTSHPAADRRPEGESRPLAAASLRYVEFPDGRSLLAALSDENVHAVAHQVSYRGLSAPAALCYRADHRQLQTPGWAAALKKVLSTYGGEAQVIAPLVPAESWMDPVDMLLGAPLLPASLQPAQEILVLLHSASAMRGVRDLFLALGFPFQVGLAQEPGGKEKFIVLAGLESRGRELLLDLLADRSEITVLARDWQTTAPTCSLYVERGHCHPHAVFLQRLASQTTTPFTDGERLLASRSACLRVTLRADTLLSYNAVMRPLAPSITQAEPLPVEKPASASRARIEQRILEEELDRVELRVEKTVGRRGRARTMGSLDEEAARLKMELLSCSQRLQEIEQSTDQVPVIYGYTGSDLDALRALLRSLPYSIKELLLCAFFEPQPDEPQQPWLFLLPASSTGVVRLSTAGPPWVRFLGQRDSASAEPVVYVPEGHRLVPSAASLGARQLARLLDVDEAGSRSRERRLLMPIAGQPGARWRLQRLPEPLCEPVLKRLSTLSSGRWEASRQAVPPAAPAAETSWQLNLDEYERRISAALGTSLDQLDEQVARLAGPVSKLKSALVERKEWFDELSAVERRVRTGQQRDIVSEMSGLELAARRFAAAHSGLSQALLTAIERRQDLEQIWAQLAPPVAAPTAAPATAAATVEDPDVR